MGSSWQDLVLAVGQFVLVLSLWPMIRAREKPPLTTSVLNVVVLYIFAFTFLTLTLRLSMATSIAGGTAWLLLAVQRFFGKK